MSCRDGGGTCLFLTAARSRLQHQRDIRGHLGQDGAAANPFFEGDPPWVQHVPHIDARAEPSGGIGEGIGDLVSRCFLHVSTSRHLRTLRARCTILWCHPSRSFCSWENEAPGVKKEFAPTCTAGWGMAGFFPPCLIPRTSPQHHYWGHREAGVLQKLAEHRDVKQLIGGQHHSPDAS